MSRKMLLADFSLEGPKGDNQDVTFSVLFNESGSIGVVADGVGGMGGGRLAAQCVRRAAEEASFGDGFEPTRVIENAHRYINELSVPKAATTATVVLCWNMRLVFAHTGDSRVYLIRGNGLKTLTTDQTEAALLVRDGILTKAAARSYHRRNVLTHAVEKGEHLSIEKGTFDLMVGDRVVIMTDGIHKILNKRQIQNLSSSCENAVAFSEAIKSEVADKLVDDASLVVIDV
jgi:protein phosphatase